MRDQQRLHAILHGRVQGVSFRYYTTLRAAELGLTGWVRNLPDGTVEVIAEGSRPQLDELLNYLHHGPVGARVLAVDSDWQAWGGAFEHFSIR